MSLSSCLAGPCRSLAYWVQCAMGVYSKSSGMYACSLLELDPNVSYLSMILHPFKSGPTRGHSALNLLLISIPQLAQLKYQVNGEPLKLVDEFIYFGSNISSTEYDVNIHTGEALAAISGLSTTGKSDFSDKMIWEFFQAVAMSVLLYGCTTLTLMKCLGKS